jgi:hypothetical protein
MSTTPPEQPPTEPPPPTEARRASAYGALPGNVDFARMPIPGNAELIVFLLVWLVIFLIWVFSDEVGAGTFATLTVALTFGYLVSRGIAKASRVLEQ